MMPTKVKGTLWIEVEDKEYQVDYTGNLWAGRPGKYSGPPEKCYEDAPPEFEFDKVVFTPDLHRPLTQDEEDDIFNRAFDQALENAADDYYDGDEGYEEEDYSRY